MAMGMVLQAEEGKVGILPVSSNRKKVHPKEQM